MSAPERIWAYPSHVTGWSSAYCRDRPAQQVATEYARADLLATSQRELAEARAERDAAREYGKEARVLETKAEDKRIHEQHMRSIAEAALAERTKERDALLQEENCHDEELSGWERDFEQERKLREAAEARATASERQVEAMENKLRRCNWYWPEDDTSSEMCGESAQEIVQNAYDWTSEKSGEVVAIARGGIVEVTYCAYLPPADDADSDDDFWVQEETHEAAQARIDAEKARRAILNPSEKNNV